MDSYIRTTKKLEIDKPPPCTCDAIAKLTGLKKPATGHIVAKFSDLPNYNLDFNLKNTIRPDHIDTRKEINKALLNFHNRTIRGFYNNEDFIKNSGKENVFRILQKYQLNKQQNSKHKIK